MTRLLVVDDDPGLRRALSINLRARKYDVDLAADGTQALAAASREPPDAIVLELGLPDMDGVTVIEGLRGWSQAPIIVLSARTGQQDKVLALDAGADDYVTKPFGMDELLARLRVALRRLRGPAAGSTATVQLGSLWIDVDRRLVKRGTEEVHLTPTEYELLKVLLGQRGRVVTRSRLIVAVWGTAYTDAIHTLHVHIATLRRKIEDDPANPVLLRTEPGVGYRLAADDGAS
jgi:two-component system, OmpR family, KDP operon response regulator KdpE